MKARLARRVAAAALLAGTIVTTGAGSSIAVSTSGQDPPRRDEFGVIPEDGTDKDLMLPDPILDRSWPSPRPGDNAAPPAVAPDEDEIDPFDEEEVVPAPKAPAEEEGEEEDEDGTEPAPPPPVAPDARNPLAAPAPEVPEILEPEIREPAGLGEDEEPSPLERDDELNRQEMGDPEDW